MVATCVHAAPSKQVAYTARSTNDALRDMVVLSPNASKLSDRGWQRKAWIAKQTETASLCSLERVVRPTVWEQGR